MCALFRALLPRGWNIVALAHRAVNEPPAERSEYFYRDDRALQLLCVLREVTLSWTILFVAGEQAEVVPPAISIPVGAVRAFKPLVVNSIAEAQLMGLYITANVARLLARQESLHNASEALLNIGWPGAPAAANNVLDELDQRGLILRSLRKERIHPNLVEALVKSLGAEIPQWFVEMWAEKPRGSTADEAKLLSAIPTISNLQLELVTVHRRQRNAVDNVVVEWSDGRACLCVVARRDLGQEAFTYDALFVMRTTPDGGYSLATAACGDSTAPTVRTLQQLRVYPAASVLLVTDTQGSASSPQTVRLLGHCRAVEFSLASIASFRVSLPGWSLQSCQLCLDLLPRTELGRAEHQRQCLLERQQRIEQERHAVIAAIDERLRICGLQRRAVEGDGPCFLSALLCAQGRVPNEESTLSLLSAMWQFARLVNFRAYPPLAESVVTLLQALSDPRRLLPDGNVVNDAFSAFWGAAYAWAASAIARDVFVCEDDACTLYHGNLEPPAALSMQEMSCHLQGETSALAVVIRRKPELHVDWICTAAAVQQEEAAGCNDMISSLLLSQPSTATSLAEPAGIQGSLHSTAAADPAMTAEAMQPAPTDGSPMMVVQDAQRFLSLQSSNVRLRLLISDNHAGCGYMLAFLSQVAIMPDLHAQYMRVAYDVLRFCHTPEQQDICPLRHSMDAIGAEYDREHRSENMCAVVACAARRGSWARPLFTCNNSRKHRGKKQKMATLFHLDCAGYDPALVPHGAPLLCPSCLEKLRTAKPLHITLDAVRRQCVWEVTRALPELHRLGVGIVEIPFDGLCFVTALYCMTKRCASLVSGSLRR